MLLIRHHHRKICGHCHAEKFAYETKHFCCSSGQVSLMSNDILNVLYDLFTSDSEESKQLLMHIRSYNTSFAFTSFGVKCDKNLSKKNKDIYTFRVQGQVYHYIN